VSNYLRDKDLDFYCNTDNILCKLYIRLLECNNLENFRHEWCINVNALADGKKLRTYKLFKNEFGTEKYVELFMPKTYRSALCKFRCGVAPIRIDTGRYERVVRHTLCWILCPDVVVLSFSGIVVYADHLSRRDIAATLNIVVYLLI
jgi:hypothetical protein